MSKDTAHRLLEVFQEHGVLRGDFTLSSGLKSSYYFDGRMVSLWPEGAYLIGKMIFEMLAGQGVDAVGGSPLGADPIVAAVALVSHQEGKPIPAFIVRDKPKVYGTQKQIEGHIKEGWRVAIVDDVVTTGGSIFRAIEAVEAAGCQVVKVVALLDRHRGGSDELRRRGYDFTAILSADAEGVVTVI